ncbi:uncharacterized protein L969DRAFT_91871 [Mixia osmundae IAM 14324]|uniref:Replication factor C subunit 1 n=1 Tax=Mixia osmundae (strain CBS 9802 / IAM 14324 / JCM 22182 / KY 12970) TaxID=764103 RepID=G7E2T8_MIXOS|nr:uncharacterized protein L969DRAFT_91871 [Mixia osmundae IAM 14324]KEI42428.1 hypothetical protein L969DRAFT_91871 [Mixia osmundae IAM 14324]GAA97282.1 hypothetical protein E5Q_03960 [Mixia osmundae IAM 14324]
MVSPPKRKRPVIKYASEDEDGEDEANDAKLADADSDDYEPEPSTTIRSKPGKAATLARSTPRAAKKRIQDDEDSSDDLMETDKPAVKSKTTTPRASTSKAASKASASKPSAGKSVKTETITVLSSDDDDDDHKPGPVAEKPKKATPAKAKKPAQDKEEKVKKPLQAKPLPKPKVAAGLESKDVLPDPNYKPNPDAWKQGPKISAPLDPDPDFVMPQGKEGCLTGKTIVFTGELANLSRDQASDLVKRYGGRVTSGASSKTSYVVVGHEPGQSKIRQCAKLNITQINEAEFYALIRTEKAQIDDKLKKKLAEEEAKIIATAKAFDRAPKAPVVAAATDKGKGKAADANSAAAQLWTVKYAPKQIKDICGNKGNVEKLKTWLETFDTNRKSGFKKPGKDGMGVSRAVMISGPPGIGKTTAAHVVANACGYNVVELNASDTRSKKLLQTAFKSTITNTSLDGYFGEGRLNLNGDAITDKTCLVLDEVDGMSGGDRGGVGALNDFIKKTKIPIICIANDAKSQKMRPFQATCHSLPFRRPTAVELRSRMMSICYKEKLKVSAEVVEQLASGAQSDIRQIINMLSTFKLSAEQMDFDQSKDLANRSVKNALQTPFTLMDKLFAPGAFGTKSSPSLSEKQEAYFQDFNAMPLFVQENYLKHEYTIARRCDEAERQHKAAELTARAAEAISDGDLVDAMIHGSTQQWSLMPVHGMFSCVRPAALCYGSGAAFNADSSRNARMFPGWFGRNSTQGKLQRLLGEVQIRMRLSVSGDRKEIRQVYIPTLLPRLVQPLIKDGQQGIPDVIRLMDEYFLTKEEWDTVLELGIDSSKGDGLLKAIASKDKAAFTRQYNKQSHPIPFHKASEVGKPTKKIAAADKPDNEEAFEEDLEEDEEEIVEEDDDGDVTKDKLIKQSKAKVTKRRADSRSASPAPKKAKMKK